MAWEKLGFFRTPEGHGDWMNSHCQLPTPLVLDNRTVRVFFAARNAEQRSSVGYVDLVRNAAGDGFDIGAVCDGPVLSPGPIGHFNQHGVFPASIVEHDGMFYMYFIGWIEGKESPQFYASIGLATSRDGQHFEPVSPAPVMSISEHDPCLVTSPHVFRDGDIWRMNYVSGVQWSRDEEGHLHSHYHIKSATSDNLVQWDRTGHVAIDFAPGETNIARPAVIRGDDGMYRMWYSYVHSAIGKYRMGYAESKDCQTWERKDSEAGIDIDDEYAREMICYPSLFQMSGETFMLYNGDRFGKAGFGLARLLQG